jgi:hypothetical protein
VPRRRLPNQRLGSFGTRSAEGAGRHRVAAEILHNVRESIPDDVADGEAGPCLDLFGAYIILRSQ